MLGLCVFGDDVVSIMRAEQRADCITSARKEDERNRNRPLHRFNFNFSTASTNTTQNSIRFDVCFCSFGAVVEKINSK